MTEVQKKARIAVLGAGWWGAHVYIPSLLADPTVDLVAVNRRDPVALKEITDRFGIARGYADYRELLSVEKPDGVVIVSPHTVHHEQAMAALDAGAHVLIDKPMATSAREARQIVSKAADNGLQVVIPYGWNFKDFTRKAADLMRDGRIGTIRHIVCQMASPTEDLFGGEGLMETKDHMFQPQKDTWADPAKAGGYGWGQLSHALGLMYALVDLAPVEVMAMTGQSHAGVDWYDAAVVRLSNGATLALSGSSTVPKHCGYQVDIRIFGSEGMLLIDVERERMELRRKDGNDVVLDVPRGAGAYQCIEPTERLAQICLGTATRNEAPGLVGQRAVETLDAMYRAARSGHRERV
jgi:predicted dehydrogenase